MSSNLLADIIIFEKKSISQIILNRALIIGSILIDKYPNLTARVYINKDGLVEFELKKDKKVLLLNIQNPSWIEYKKNKSRKETDLLNRRQILPLLEWINEQEMDNRRKRIYKRTRKDI